MTFEYRDDDQMTLRINHLEPDYPGQIATPAIWISVSDEAFDSVSVLIPLARVEEVVAGIRDAARTAARQTTGQDNTDPTTADDPTPLRWGLGDVLHGDDDTTTVCLSGPAREPYWLELDPERAAAFRRDLAPPAAEDTIGLCGYCGVPRENHHHGYTSTADVIAASPYSRTGDEPAPAVGQPAEAHDTDRAACACSHPQERHNSACAYCPCIGYAATWPPRVTSTVEGER